MIKMNFHKDDLQRSGPRKRKAGAHVQIGDEERDSTAGRKGLCGHTGEQGAGAAADVKLTLLRINRLWHLELSEAALLLCLLSGRLASGHGFYEESSQFGERSEQSSKED